MTGKKPTEVTPERQVAPVLVHALLRYVRRVAGEDALTAVVAGSGVSANDLFSESRWFSSDEAIALAEAAARICHDEHIGVRAGIELWWLLSEHPGYLDLVRSAGDVRTALAESAVRGSKMSTGRRNCVTEIADDSVVLIGEYADVANGHRFYCGLSAGFYAQVPRAYGLIGDAVERTCQLDGAERCAYRITWRPDSNNPAPAPATYAESAERAQRRLDQLEQVHELTSQLLAAERVDEALARVTSEAGRAVQAPRYLLAVRVSDRGRLRVHHRGFREGTAETFAERLLSGSVGETDGVLLADVVSGDRHFGRLAACYPKGSHFADAERRLLRAYAQHAAAVLAHVASLEQAANDRDTAQALLDLARSLAGACTVADVARRLIDTVPRVVDCDVAALWTWDKADEALQRVAFVDPSHQVGFAGPERLVAAECPEVRTFVASPAPYILDAEQADDTTRRLLTSTQLHHVAVVPVTVHGEFVGIIGAGFRRDVPDESLLFERLTGLADHAAVALQSVRLVETMSHQARHDNLTGLANRQKLQEHSEQALAKARGTDQRVALLFIDLDRFKDVNDTMGHDAGDELIKLAAQRIADTTRPTDVLARLGGDEFLLMLPLVSDADAAMAAAERVVAALQQPFAMHDAEAVSISCSIGVACYPDHGLDYRTLVKHADAAMYDAKAKGRNAVSVYVERQAIPRQRKAQLTPH